MSIEVKRIERFYDDHPIEGDELGQATLHGAVIRYLIAVLEWMLRSQKVLIADSLNLYQDPDNPKEVPYDPDIAVIFEPQVGPNISSYTIGVDGLPPGVAMEFASQKTWKRDVEVKPNVYAEMGIPEYFAFDQNEKQVWTKQWRNKGRLIGWELDDTGKKYREMRREPDGRIWSNQLQSFVGVDPVTFYPRLYDQQGRQRLTKAEAEEKQRQQLEALMRQMGYNPDELLGNK